MSEPEIVTEPLQAWRAWQLLEERRGPSLVPIGRGDPWPRRRVAEARCWKHRRHRAPVRACTCGLYAARDLSTLRAARAPAVVGLVALWGRVIEHAHGWRAAFAYPQRLGLVCTVCLPQRGASAPAEVVAVYDRGSLVPVCEPHLGLAIEVGAVPRGVIQAGSILARLTDAYAVEPLPPTHAATSDAGPVRR